MIVQQEPIRRVVKQYDDYLFPAATEALSGSVVQYIGTNTTNYKNGYFYKCVEVDTAPGTYTWQQVDVQPSSGGGSTSATATLSISGWSGNSQTVNVTGVTASNNVIVAPAPADQSAYTTAGILCTAQAAGSLTFTCDTVPSGDLSVNILML